MTAESQSAQTTSGASPTARDAELIARILGGERELFHELVRPYEKSVYYATFSILQNEQDAEDAAQETVLKALKNLHNFRAESKFSTWLISIAINEARARLRHARVLTLESLDQPREEDEDSSFTPAVITDWREVPLQALERKELREQLQKAIASLPEIYREVLLLRDVEEFNIAETAAALGEAPSVQAQGFGNTWRSAKYHLRPDTAVKQSGSGHWMCRYLHSRSE